ncbi:serine/arginine repetitive matrix protein 1-like [Mustela putorius furo]|uniref:Serine/arginine repetitive matrix protein 1-like n=1 Tax=Mustela putorius furo TaxID=9669 RepID=A0A8U0SE64_MUSPF|nr:serine/arginine repetitive matrix protein 1-like [Mustela putorius furo]
MRAAPPLQEVDLTGAKTNKGRLWWELRKRRALSQQAGPIEMQIARPRPRRATSRPLTSQPPRRAGLNGPIDARRRSPPRLAPLPRGRLQPRARPAARPPGRPATQASRARAGLAVAVSRRRLLVLTAAPRPHRRSPPAPEGGRGPARGGPPFCARNRKMRSAAELKTKKQKQQQNPKQEEVPTFHRGGAEHFWLRRRFSRMLCKC